MVNRRRWWKILPRQLRNLPADLAAVGLLTVAALLTATLPLVDETPLRVVLGLPFVLFLPGYALVAALFPEAGPGRAGEENGEGDEDGTDNEGGSNASRERRESTTRTASVDGAAIDGVERVVLSFGTSIAVVSLTGLVLNFTPWAIRLVPILVGVGGVTLACSTVAAHRRWELPAEERFRVPYRQWYRKGRGELFDPETQMDAAVNVLLALSILVAAVSVGYAVAVPKQGESFTEFYVLTENDEGGYVADDYPTEFVRGESKPLVVGIGNREYEPTNYTVVVELQDVEFAGNSTAVRDERELGRFGTRVVHNATRHHEYTVTPTMTGTRLRLQLLLYAGEVPANPRVATAYREVHLWINVTDDS